MIYLFALFSDLYHRWNPYYFPRSELFVVEATWAWATRRRPTTSGRLSGERDIWLSFRSWRHLQRNHALTLAFTRSSKAFYDLQLQWWRFASDALRLKIHRHIPWCFAPWSSSSACRICVKYSRRHRPQRSDRYEWWFPSSFTVFRRIWWNLGQPYFYAHKQKSSILLRICLPVVGGTILGWPKGICRMSNDGSSRR